MAVEKIHIDPFLELAKQHPVLDVRSPGEFNHAYIPGAYSLPLFSDEERKIVGTAYKQESREQAIKIGLDFFGVKMRRMVEEVESVVKNRKWGIGAELQTKDSRLVLVHCWRGGMRSEAVAWLLNLYGFKVYTLWVVIKNSGIMYLIHLSFPINSIFLAVTPDQGKRSY